MATETLSEKALDADVYNAIATEKVDGTCCYVTNYKGKIQLSCLLKVLSQLLYKSWTPVNSKNLTVVKLKKKITVLLFTYL